MSDTEIIIKGEIHTSKGDLKEERKILTEGVDHLILEGIEERDWSFKPSQYWFGYILLIFEYLFARLIYVDKSILEDLADAQDAKISYTRKSNVSILRNSHVGLKIFAAGLFFLLIILATTVGVVGNRLQGSLLLLMSSLVPLLILRVHESRRVDTGRDEKMAKMIESAAQTDDKIVAIVGAAHAKRIPKNLSDDLPDPDLRSPAYKMYSLQSIKELIYPGIILFSVLYVVYSGFITYIIYIS